MVSREQPPHLGLQLRTAGYPRRQLPADPLVVPGPRHPQRPAGHRVRDPMLIPLGSDQRGHRYRPVASLTQRATLRPDPLCPTRPDPLVHRFT